MFLRSLTLKGFKSFAEATTLELEPGLTVVVGPNGSGKSNIVDAVAWVLGAQGPRTVRSSRMEDVIFAGNGRRPALGRAEVTLTIDNSSGLLPIGFTEVTVTRTLFRSSGESEYAINAVPCRLLDVQELLSDTGVGRQQHVIVSQGNLDQVLDVRPEERRLIVEEAAGILKFRRRKEKAGRRLEATEAHFVRLTDLLREQRRQMRPLERQAEAARRHHELAAELRALRLHLAGRSLASLTTRSEAGAREQARLEAAEAAASAEVRRLDGDVAAFEARLGSVEGGGLDGTIARLEALRERARGLGAVLAERSRSLSAELAAAEDGDDVLARLEADAAGLAAELAAIEALSSGVAAAGAGLAEAEAELAERRRAVTQREAVEQAAQRAAETRGQLAALQAAADRGRAELADLEGTVAAARGRAEECERRLAAGRQALREVEQESAAAGQGVDAAGSQLSIAEGVLTEAAARTRAAERRRDDLRARVEALTMATGAPSVVRDTAAGMLGALLDLVEIDAGWEAAVEAALGDALCSLVVERVDVARSALAAGTTGSVLVAGDLGGNTGVTAGQPADAAGAVPVRGLVHAGRPDVAALLDRLLGGTVAVAGDWEAAFDVALAAPDLVVVSRGGDRFSSTGWRTAGNGASVAAALAEARRGATEAAGEADRAATAEAECRVVMEAAKAALDEERATLAGVKERLAEARAAVARLDADHRAASAEASTVGHHLEARARQLAEDTRRAAALEERLVDLVQAAEAPAGHASIDLDAERHRVAEEAQALAARRAQLAAQAEAAAHRRVDLTRRLTAVEAQTEQARSRRSVADARAARTEADLGHTRSLAQAVVNSLDGIDVHLTGLRERQERRAAAVRAMAAALEDCRRLRIDAERRLEEVRARSRRAELDQAETNLRLEAAVEALRRDLDCEPDVAIAAECPPVPAGSSPTNRARELERELRLMGPVNPLAVEELAALEERHAFLTAQLEDVKTTRRDLAKVIRSVEAEMTELLAAAYADVADNFADLFQTLFPGGEGRLRLTEPDRILDAGIDIEARPGGKSARKLSLLSGGERSLCAMAFLFAVFRSRPSPFYLLDEVEAALDDVNLHRFLRLLDEFRRTTQLLVVTHQKRTMEAADCLFGVTMQPGGTSRVLSERAPARA